MLDKVAIVIATAGYVGFVPVVPGTFPPTTLGGFKGVGEGGTIGAPAAVANAIADALAPLGVPISELPVTPDRLFRLLAGRRR